MSMTDPIADMLTRIRNALLANHKKVVIPHSKINFRILEILKEEGYIDSIAKVDDSLQGSIRVFLRYGPRGERVLNRLDRVSRPGRRVYVSVEQIPEIMGGLGIAIMTTSRGIITNREAKHLHVGGEVLCRIS